MRPGAVLRYLATSVTELALPVHRQGLVSGIRVGYVVLLCFSALAFGAWAFDLSEWRWEYLVLLGVNLATQSSASLALRLRRGVLLLVTVNFMADAGILTAFIYFTGGASSPLVATYVIVIAMLSLFSNLGVTILMAVFIIVCFTAMMLLETAGVLPLQHVPGLSEHAPSTGFTMVAIGCCVLIVGVPAFFFGATLHVLRAREAALGNRTSQLVQAATQRSQFVASMTHELRTPIHGVQGLSDVIAAGVYGPVTAKQRDACLSIKRSAQNLLSLIDDLLSLTRAEAGKIEAHPGTVQILELVERVTVSVSWMVGTKNLTLGTEIAPELPSVVSDERWLAHVLVNLVSNAVKFTPEGGRVTVRATRRAAAVVFEVIDTGIGIAPEQHAAIFEPFRQIDHGDAKGYGGAGLGLALVARLIDLLGAQLELESVVGKGSTFRVIVPLAWRGRSAAQGGRSPLPPVPAECAPAQVSGPMPAQASGPVPAQVSAQASGPVSAQVLARPGRNTAPHALAIK